VTQDGEGMQDTPRLRTSGGQLVGTSDDDPVPFVWFTNADDVSIADPTLRASAAEDSSSRSWQPLPYAICQMVERAFKSKAKTVIYMNYAADFTKMIQTHKSTGARVGITRRQMKMEGTTIGLQSRKDWEIQNLKIESMAAASQTLAEVERQLFCISQDMVRQKTFKTQNFCHSG
jgi:hypothetical protein